MPMDPKRYPPNWTQIARHVKQSANWRCQECGKACLLPEQSKALLAHDRSAWAVSTLTVAHLNHEPSDCSFENLRALCAPCHLRYDGQREQMAIKKMRKREWLGQLKLFQEGA